jgi:PAS domain S-box-containing protein
VKQLNHTAAALTGWNEGEAEGKLLEHVYPIIHERTREKVRNPVDRVLKTTAMADLPHWFLLLSKDGREIPIDDSASLVRNETGEITGLVLVFHDRTIERQAEHALRESEEKYRVLVEQASDGIFFADAQGHILDVNPSGCAMLGYSHDELLNFTMNDLISGDDKTEPALQIGEADPGRSIVWERLMIRKDGSLLPVEYSRKIMADGRMQKIVRDISERREMEEFLRDIQRREAVGILSSGIAHDFNNLLAVMMGNISFAQTQLPAQHPVHKNLGQALKAIESAAELTRQILAYSGKGKFQIRTIDVGEEIRTHAGVFTATMPKNVKLVTHFPPTPVYVNGDPGQVKQIVMNLIVNGADAIGEKQGTVAVSLSSIDLGKDELTQYGKLTNTVLKEGRYALLEVRDNGIGMKPETMRHIFDPFFTTKFIGRGLGLSAVLGIIRGHDGGIAVDSVEGEGATFRVILPVAPIPEPEPEPAAKAEESLHGSHTPTTVLVIDDEEDVAAMAKEILETEDYTVMIELNPIRGIEMYKQHRSEIGAVLLDMTMPEMSGKDVVEALRAIDPGVKIIISSGYSESEVQKQIGMGKVSGFIQKPYPLQLLVTKVQSVM